MPNNEPVVNTLPPRKRQALQTINFTCTETYFMSTLQSMITSANALNLIANYLGTPLSITMDDLKRYVGLENIKNELDFIKLDLESFAEIFTTPLRGDATFDGVLMAGEDVLERAEMILNRYEMYEAKINDLIDQYEYTMGAIEYTVGKAEEIPKLIEDKIKEYQEKFNDVINAIKEFDINKLPEDVLNCLSGLSVIRDSVVAINAVTESVNNVTKAAKTLKSKPTIKSAYNLISTLRRVLTALKEMKAQAERIMKTIERIKKLLLSNGNYVNLAMNLITKGVGFLEIPPAYATVYPFNNGYKTSGGSVFQWDETPDNQRFSYEHPAGTQVRVEPNGDAVVRSKNQFQIVVDGDADIVVKKALSIRVEGNTKIISKGQTHIEAGTECNVYADETVNVVSNNIFGVAKEDVSVIANNNAFIVGKNCEVASEELTQLSSGNMISIKAPTVEIKADSKFEVVTAMERHQSGSECRINAGKIMLN